jgi:glucokinase
LNIGAFDIGGSKTIVALSDERGNFLEKETFQTLTADAAAHFARCRDVLFEQLSKHGLAPGALSGIGVNLPGMVDDQSGVLLDAPFAAWRDLPARAMFRELTGVQTVVVDNDVKSCALGETRFGYKDQYPSFVWITVSTGIGAAVYLPGGVWRGANNLAGEIGHVKVAFEGARRCSCGQFGCLEAHASGTAITAQLRALNIAPNAAAGARLAYEGDRAARAVFDEAAGFIAAGLSAAANLINPHALILGGGVAESLDLLLPTIREKLRAYAIRPRWDIPIVKTKLGYEAALYGAVASALHGIEERLFLDK